VVATPVRLGERAGLTDTPQTSTGGRWPHRADLIAIALLVGFPIVMFALPAAVGHPLLPGDDLYQNYPLRVLSGHVLSLGHLPLWDAWIWSGTPLLGGFNAGSLYPGTFLFAFGSPIVAWVVNEIAVYAVCGVGLYLLLRRHRLIPLAAAIGAASFTYAGFMPSHLIHIGLVQGMSWAPWMLLAMEELAQGTRHRLAWFAVLVAGGGLVVLSGEPRAMSNVAVVVVLYLAVLLWQSRYRRQLVTAVAVGALLAVALGAVQLLPGLAFLRTSQRGNVGYSWYAFGSLAPRQLVYSVVPYLLGGYNQLHLLPNFAPSTYHLPEVMGYGGLLALVALFTLPFWWRAEYRRIWAWIAMIAVGLVLSFGSHTPFGRVLAVIPLYGHQRLQSRNLGVVDLGLAGVLACWVDSMFKAPRTAPPRVRHIAERVLALAPTAIVVALVAMAWVAGGTLQRFLGVSKVHTGFFGPLGWYLVTALALSIAIGIFAVGYRRLTARTRAGVLVVLVVLDLGLALLNQQLGPVDTTELRRHTAVTAPIAAALSHGGRYAVFDPAGRVSSSSDQLANALFPELNILYELPSVQGYASTVDATYEAQTATHTRRVITESALAGPEADDLDLTLLLVPSSYVEAATGPSSSARTPVDEDLVAALAPSHWRRAGHYGRYLAYVNTRARGRAWLVPAHPNRAVGADAAVRVVRVGAQDDETDVVRSSTPVLLVRSVAYGDGWKAELRSDGHVRTVDAHRRGLVQAVAVPAGTTTVTWSYRPPGLEVGIVLTVLALIVLVGLGVVGAVRIARKRREEPARDVA
jgi:hypothetical protein